MTQKEEEIIVTGTIEGVLDAQTEVFEWLKALTSSSEVQGTLTVVLSHAGRGISDRDTIETFKYRLDESLEGFAEDIVDNAVNYMTEANIKGDQKFAVRVKIGGMWRRVNFRLTMPRTEQDDRLDFGPEIETPSNKGIVHQNMRHVEVAYNQLIKMAAIAHESKDRLISRQERVINELTNECRTLRMERDEVLGTAWARKMKEKEIEEERERKEKVGALVMTGGSLLLAKAMGMPVDPTALLSQITGDPASQDLQATGSSSTDGDLELLDAFIDDLQATHVEQLMTLLPAAQVQRLQQIYQRSQLRKMSRETRAHTAQNGVNGTSSSRTSA